MASIESINPARILWCCNDRGISPESLADDLNIASSTIERVLEGSGGLSYRQLRKLADYFGRGVLFFLERGEVNAEELHSPQFRTLANQKPTLTPHVRSLIQRVERQRDVFLALREDEDDYAKSAQFAPPDLDDTDVETAAEKVRSWLGLASYKNDFGSYRDAVESRGILVFLSNGYAGRWKIPKDDPVCGFSLYRADCPVIFVVKQDFPSRQAFTLAHELAHVLLHKVSSIDEHSDFDSRERHERDANGFAGYFLVPDEYLAQIDLVQKPNQVSDFDLWLKPYRAAWGVSNDVLLLRLKECGSISQREYERFRALPKPKPPTRSGGSRYRNTEPRKIFGDPFVRTVLTALDEERITLTKASKYLDNLKIKDLRKLEQAYAGI